MIKVAHVVTAYLSVVTILDSKLRAIASQSGFELSVISSPPENGMKTSSVRHLSVPMSRQISVFKDMRSVYALYRLLRREKFDVVHSHTAKAGSITAIAAKLAGVPCICHTSHGLPFFDGQGRFTYFIYRSLEKMACLFRDHLFTQNRRDMAECIKLMGSPDKVSYEGNGVDVEFVAESALKECPLVKSQFPYCPSGVKLVILSRLEPVKRVEDFVRVVSILKNKGIPVSAVIAGDGIQKPVIQAMIQEMGLADTVAMIGFTSNPHGLLETADIVLLCSEKEGIPRAVMEAMALEKPVVATDVLGTQELVVDEQTGYLVPLGDVDMMASRIELLIKKKELRSELGKAGKKRVQESFNDKMIARSLCEYYSVYMKNYSN